MKENPTPYSNLVIEGEPRGNHSCDIDDELISPRYFLEAIDIVISDVSIAHKTMGPICSF